MKKSDLLELPFFFDRYINLTDDLELITLLQNYAPNTLFDNIGQLESLQNNVYAPNKWTVKDILQHVIDTERIMAYRALRFSRNDNTELSGYEEEVLVANSTADNRTVNDLLAEFKVVRESTIYLFKNMSDDMLLRSGVANAVPISVLALGLVIVGHAIHHHNIIAERYLPLLV